MKSPKCHFFRFTIIEIIFAIAIVSILAGLTIRAIGISKGRAKYTKWLTYNAMLNKDPATVLNFNFIDTQSFTSIDGENYPALHNSATASEAEGFEPREYNGTIYGASWLRGKGRTRFHNALQFDGRKSYVEIPGLKALDMVPEKDDFTIMLWANFDNVRSTQVLCGRSVWNKTAQYDLYLKNGNLEADVGLAAFGWKQPVLQPGRWYHVAIASQSGNFKIYLDGAEMTSKYQVKGAPTRETRADVPLVIGAINTNNKQKIRYFFQGRMDEFVLIRKYLDASEVRRHYEVGLEN